MRAGWEELDTSERRPVEENDLSATHWPVFLGSNVSLPSTLDLQKRLSGSSNRDILEESALRLELNPGSGDECLRPQGGIDGPALLHGHLFAGRLEELDKLRHSRGKYTYYVGSTGRWAGRAQQVVLDLTLDWRKSFSRDSRCKPRDRASPD